MPDITSADWRGLKTMELRVGDLSDIVWPNGEAPDTDTIQIDTADLIKTLPASARLNPETPDINDRIEAVPASSLGIMRDDLPAVAKKMVQAYFWNKSEYGTLPVELHQDENGDWGLQIKDEALEECGWSRDEKTGQLVQTDPEAEGYDVTMAPGVLTDGNGHYYDAHDLPAGMTWERGSKTPVVDDGYVMGPDGRAVTELNLALDRFQGKDYNDEWEYVKDGVFKNKESGELWQYDREIAEIQADLDAEEAREAGALGEDDPYKTETPILLTKDPVPDFDYRNPVIGVDPIGFDPRRELIGGGDVPLDPSELWPPMEDSQTGPGLYDGTTRSWMGFKGGSGSKIQIKDDNPTYVRQAVEPAEKKAGRALPSVDSKAVKDGSELSL